jgi:hypothetical protein
MRKPQEKQRIQVEIFKTAKSTFLIIYLLNLFVIVRFGSLLLLDFDGELGEVDGSFHGI